MRSTILTIAASFAFVTTAHAADIFVRPARGLEITQAQQAEVTDLVKRAVRNMPEHHLVENENAAEFALQPSIVVRNDRQLLRVEKVKNGEILAMSEEAINSVNASNDRAMAVTETALQAEPTAADALSPARSSDDEMAMNDLRGERGALGQHASTSRPYAPARERDSVSGTTTSMDDAQSNEVRGPSPILSRHDYPGYFQLGVGPAFGAGLDTNGVMTDVLAAYDYDLNFQTALRGGLDMSFAQASDTAHFIEALVGADFYQGQNLTTFGKPYIGADLGYAFARDNQSRNADGIAVGAGAGFKFAASQLNMDVNLHYSLLTAQLQNTNPSVFGIKLAVNF